MNNAAPPTLSAATDDCIRALEWITSISQCQPQSYVGKTQLRYSGRPLQKARVKPGSRYQCLAPACRCNSVLKRLRESNLHSISRNRPTALRFRDMPGVTRCRFGALNGLKRRSMTLNLNASSKRGTTVHLSTERHRALVKPPRHADGYAGQRQSPLAGM